ncbi:MAG: ribosome small subunit-dependent GTPase A [Planctomycetes bacterium]|nr:ribosome small subunit-dependent GTPase A [Planctomycetota bacterium]
MKGRIFRIAANRYVVHAENGVFSCAFTGRAKRERRHVLRLAAVGDYVEFEPSAADEGSIGEVLPRRSKLSRHDAFRPRYEQVIAANVDQLVVVHAAAQPDLSLLTVDKCTVMGEASGLACLVCVNKLDLADVRGSVAHYPSIGFPLVLTSAAKGAGTAALREALRGRTSVLLGPSGVGKTSLLNALRPDFAMKVGEVSERTGEGRHTTTWVELRELEPGTLVIDTPGLEFFTLWGVEIENLAAHFPEFVSRMPRCKFRAGCSHTREPNCAVVEALERGEIARSRYESYVRIREDLIKKRRELG